MKFNCGLLLFSVLCVLGATVATTIPLDARGMCSDKKTNSYTKDNWNKLGMTEWLRYWEYENIVKSDNNDIETDAAFSSYWGVGQSFDCTITNECERPQCSSLDRPDQSYDYEQAMMVFTSMANFNKYCVRLYGAMNMAQIDYNTLQTTIQDKFYPSEKPANQAGIIGLNALMAGVGIVAAFLGPLGAPVAVAANSVKEVVCGIARGFTAQMTAADLSLKTIAEMGEVINDGMADVRTRIENEHNSLLRMGTSYYSTLTQLRDVFDGGVWVNEKDIPILHGDVTVEQTRKFFNDMVYTMAINKWWKEQGVYIFSRKMTKEDCESETYRYSNLDDLKDLPKLCQNGRAYWLAKPYSNFWPYDTGLQTPPGMENMKDVVGFEPSVALKSSVDAFNKGGYKFSADSLLDEDFIFEPDTFRKGATFMGVFNLPVCEFESSDQWEDANLPYTTLWWLNILENRPEGLREDKGKAVHACLCSTAKDHNGVSIEEYEDAGEESFKSYVADAGKCKHLDRYRT